MNNLTIQHKYIVFIDNFLEIMLVNFVDILVYPRTKEIILEYFFISSIW